MSMWVRLIGSRAHFLTVLRLWVYVVEHTQNPPSGGTIACYFSSYSQKHEPGSALEAK